VAVVQGVEGVASETRLEFERITRNWGAMATAKASMSYPHVTKTPGVCGGKACIDGTRIRVNNVVFLHKDGANDQKILEAYPDLTPAQIHAALAYYYDNREEIDAELAADKSWAESLDR
jgi:uncharacterized protein (DUF433 family)